MYVAVWKFTVKKGSEAEFEAIYGSSGEWSSLFRRAAGYLGTDLIRISGESNRYLTIDRWETEHAWRNFKQQYAEEYGTLDRRCDGLKDKEEMIADGSAV